RQEVRRFLVVTVREVLAGWAEFLTSRVVLAQDRHGFRPRRDPGRSANTVNDNPRECIERHWVLGIFLGQLEESRRQLFRFGVYVVEDFLPFLVGLGLPDGFRVCLHGVLVNLEKRLVLLSGLCGLLLQLACRRRRWYGQRQDQETH